MGYSFGCLLSILLWNFNRQEKLGKIINKVRGKKSLSMINFFLLSTVFIILMFLLGLFLNRELYNFIIAFLVIDFSSTERENINICRGKTLDEGIFNISSAIVCGFIAPLFYIMIFHNIVSIIYIVIIIGNNNYNNKLLENLSKTLNILPSFIAQLLLCICNIHKLKYIGEIFTKEYLKNIIINPLLNLDILASYIYNFNFYYYTKIEGNTYVKSYGFKDSKKVNERAIKDYQKGAYISSMIFFIIFIVIYFIKNRLL